MQKMFPIYFSILRSQEGAFATYAAVLIFVVSISAYGGLYFLNKSQEGAQAVLIQQVLQKEEDLRPEGLDAIFALQKRLKSIGLVISSHSFSANTFSLIENNAHPRVAFTTYLFDGEVNKVVLQGEAENYQTLAKQISLLESDVNINKLEFGGLSVRDNGRVVFNLTLYLLPSALISAR